jgi:GntR family transcriptional regulator/MocR family aminotransferase
MPYGVREQLLHWANERGAYIIEDDYDGEFRYEGKPIPSLQSLDRQDRVIYIGTFSKAFTPALRMNYMVLPPSLMVELKRMPFLLQGPSRIEQWAMQAFFEKGHWFRHVRRMRNTYRKKHHQLIEWLKCHFGQYVTISGHSAGLHLQVKVRSSVKAEELCKRAFQAGVCVYTFGKMWMKEPSLEDIEHPSIYLGFAGISIGDMEKGVPLLKKAWTDVLRE